ncbi:MAG: hypothetical protein JRJ85_22210 [Deltaproteobacteria bacterium]|nr:hypothetical protein [Deltaproteobacteria bacterium]
MNDGQAFFLDTVTKKYIKGCLLKKAQGVVFRKNKKISVLTERLTADKPDHMPLWKMSRKGGVKGEQKDQINGNRKTK